jgi:type IV pilus assembly protein PilZ
MSEFHSTAMPSAFAPVMGKAAASVGVSGASAGTGGPVGGGNAARPSVIQLVFREKGALYAAYIPAFTDGGLFVPTTREYLLGDDIYLLLTLPEDPQRYPVAGRIAWITPPNASGGRTQGVGVRFPADDKTRLLRVKIEQILGTNISSSKPTQTI